MNQSPWSNTTQLPTMAKIFDLNVKSQAILLQIVLFILNCTQLKKTTPLDEVEDDIPVGDLNNETSPEEESLKIIHMSIIARRL